MVQTQETLNELRMLSRGIAPPLLVDRGLAAAITEAAARSLVPVTVDLDVPLLPTHIESTAYYVVSEALANLNKHSPGPEVVRQVFSRQRRNDPVQQLTQREREVLELMAQGQEAPRWHNYGMTRARLSTTVDSGLLADARALLPGGTDAAVVDAALRALLLAHRAAEIDAAYAEAYRRSPMNSNDDWGDLTTFLDEARRS